MKITKDIIHAGWLACPHLSKATIHKILEAALTLSDQDEWRPIPGYERYEASSLGNVRRARDEKGRFIGRILEPHRSPTGHLKVSVYADKRQWRSGVHRLVCVAFHGPAPDAHSVVCHNDGNPENNRPENLRWGTFQDNAEDKKRHAFERAGSLKIAMAIRNRDYRNLTDLEMEAVRRHEKSKMINRLRSIQEGRP